METQAEIVPGLLPDRSQSARQKSTQKSKVGNATTLLPTTDGRSIWARLMRETFKGLLVHCGGADVVSETQRLVARRISTLEAELVFMEDRFAATRAAGGEPDMAKLDLYGRLADRQRRLADPLGWQRMPRDVTPTLDQYLRQKQSEAVE
jgi:hypothetical protein